MQSESLKICKIVITVINSVKIKSMYNRIKLSKAWEKLILNRKFVAAKVADYAKKSACVKGSFPSETKGSVGNNWYNKKNVTL